MQHRFNKLATSSPAEFDYVIIGAGSAGSAIAYRLGHRIAIMEGGRIVQIGTPREINHAPSTEYVANFVAQINPLCVLTAKDILAFSRLPAKTKSGAQTISATTPVTRIIYRLDQTEHPLAVSQNNKTIGQIDKSFLLACLLFFTAYHP